MAWSEVNRFEELPVDVSVRTISRILVNLAFGGLLTMVFLTQVVGAPDFVDGWRIAVFSLAFAVIAVSHHHLSSPDETPIRTRNFFVFLAIAVVLLEVFHRSRTVVGFGIHRELELLFVFLLVLVALVVYPDYRAFSTEQWTFVGCFAVVIGLFFYHTLAAYPSVETAQWPLWACLVAGINLLVIPRFVPERAFLWSLAGLAALASLAGLRALLVGEYTYLFFEVQIYNTRVVEPLGSEFPRLQSVFPNPNTFGLVAFAGLAASTILFDRTVRELDLTVHDRGWVPALAAIGLFAINTGGLVYSVSRASWFAAAVFLGVYLPVAVGGRRMVPVSVLAGGVFSIGAIVAVYEGWFPADPANRFDLWIASVEAIRESPSWLGHGFVSTTDFIAPYLSEDVEATPHNTYLSMVIRTGYLGGLAYVALIAGGILYGAANRQVVRVGMLAFTIAWAVHQLFESYSLIQWTIPAVLSTLALGYLLFAPREEPVTGTDQPTSRSETPPSE